MPQEGKGMLKKLSPKLLRSEIQKIRCVKCQLCNFS